MEMWYPFCIPSLDKDNYAYRDSTAFSCMRMRGPFPRLAGTRFIPGKVFCPAGGNTGLRPGPYRVRRPTGVRMPPAAMGTAQWARALVLRGQVHKNVLGIRRAISSGKGVIFSHRFPFLPNSDRTQGYNKA